MWYVNIEYRYTYNMVVESFILTMWYVNSLGWKEQRKVILEFYINYVICKCLLKKKVKSCGCCFILTMWYVNFT